MRPQHNQFLLYKLTPPYRSHKLCLLYPSRYTSKSTPRLYQHLQVYRFTKSAQPKCPHDKLLPTTPISLAPNNPTSHPLSPPILSPKPRPPPPRPTNSHHPIYLFHTFFLFLSDPAPNNLRNSPPFPAPLTLTYTNHPALRTPCAPSNSLYCYPPFIFP